MVEIWVVKRKNSSSTTWIFSFFFLLKIYLDNILNYFLSVNKFKLFCFFQLVPGIQIIQPNRRIKHTRTTCEILLKSSFVGSASRARTQTPLVCVSPMADDIPCCESKFFLFVLVIIGLVVFAGLMAGLTLGLMSLGLVDLEVLSKSGRPQDRIHACTVYSLSLLHLCVRVCVCFQFELIL